MIEIIKQAIGNEVTRAEINEILTVAQAHGMLPPRTRLIPMNLEDNAWDPETPGQDDEN